MLVDRISLNIALKHLEQVENNEGLVTNIILSYKNNMTDVTKTSPAFDDLDVLRAYIDKYAPLTPFSDFDCIPFLFFELKKFTIEKNETNRNLVYNNNGSFVSTSNNINKISIKNLNEGYLSHLVDVRDVFSKLKINEYILNQDGYIECGYIELHKEEAMIALEKLYNKYK